MEFLSAALKKFTEKFHELQSVRVDIRAERVYAQIERVSYHEHDSEYYRSHYAAAEH